MIARRCAAREDARRIATCDGGGTLYLNGGAAPSELQTHAGGSYQWNNYIVAGGDVIAQRVHEIGQAAKTLYFHKDHLGSISTITNDAGAVVERLSYDPWGKRRNADGTDDSAGALTSSASRGFTGHEMLDGVDLVHMNGRVSFALHAAAPR